MRIQNTRTVDDANGVDDSLDNFWLSSLAEIWNAFDEWLHDMIVTQADLDGISGLQDFKDQRRQDEIASHRALAVLMLARSIL